MKNSSIGPPAGKGPISDLSEITNNSPKTKSSFLAQSFAAARNRVHASLPAAVRRLLSDRSVRATVFNGILSRSIVLAIFVFLGQMQMTPAPTAGTNTAYLSLANVSIARIVREEVATADINWYVGIAEQGYHPGPFTNDQQRNWAFFPLFPILLRLAALITREFVLTGMALSHIFFFVALFLLHRVSVQFGLSADDADRCLFYLAFFPTSYFFSLPLPESLFLMLTLASFFFAKQSSWWLAGLSGALASATRTSGLLLLPVIGFLYWQEHRPLTLRRLRPNVLALLLIPTGLLAFMIYLQRLTGDALAFKDTMAVWGRKPGFFLSPLADYLMHPRVLAAGWDFKVLNFLSATLALVSGAVLLRRRQFSLAIFALISVLLTLSSGLLQSQARYAMVIFPIYMVLATWGRRPKIDQLIRAIFVVLFGLLTALFSGHFVFVLS
ncbi:MAG TPA: mannosyltransferase family protein [Pyrinomonadaceae bacterium]|nr:mannosyltransferase family protein [Pyrinomonadaceae bacterium]